MTIIKTKAILSNEIDLTVIERYKIQRQIHKI